MGANSQSLPPFVKNRTTSHRNRYESIVDLTRRLFQQKTQTDRAPFSLRAAGSTLRPVSPTGWKRSRRQNRYKSILCHEDTYLLELVRYIHLNPLRAKLIKDFDFFKSRRRVAAWSLLCFWAVRELGISMTELSRKLNLSLPGVSLSVTRGEKIAEINGLKL